MIYWCNGKVNIPLYSQHLCMPKWWKLRLKNSLYRKFSNVNVKLFSNCESTFQCLSFRNSHLSSTYSEFFRGIGNLVNSFLIFDNLFLLWIDFNNNAASTINFERKLPSKYDKHFLISQTILFKKWFTKKTFQYCDNNLLIS